MTERLPAAGQWKPDPPTVGSIVTFADGYSFRVTEGGPNVMRICIECGSDCYATLDYEDPRCGPCLETRAGRNAIGRTP